MVSSVPTAFHELVLHDPLFAAEGMNIDEAAAHLNSIEVTAGHLEKVFAADSWMRRLFFLRYPISLHVLPIPFLRCFLEC